MTANDSELLGQFAREQSQDAFTALVNRHLNLVYSAALRQVRSPQLAEEVSQTVFTQLACSAATLQPTTILPAWLYQVTRHTAIDLIRSEARRQAREQIAYQMSELHEPSAEWPRIEPLLDEAIASLEEPDRAALLLRFFENKSLREIGIALGSSEDAAQKRVGRAVDRLRDYFSRRQISVGAAALAALLTTHAVHAAPAGLAASVTTGAVLSAAAFSSPVTTTLIKSIAMTTLQKTAVAVVVTAALAVAVYENRQTVSLRAELEAVKQQQVQQAPLTAQVQQLQQERDRATNRAAALAGENASLKKSPPDVLKLRGEVGRLRQANSEIGSTNAISKLTSNPETKKLMRDQQKMGMAMIFKGFTQNAGLSADMSDKFNDLLADHIMDNVNNVTTALRDKPTPDQLTQIFAAQEATLQEKIQTLLGPDGLAKYQDYSKNLLGTLTADQFKSKLTGTDAEQQDKSQQLAKLLHESTQAALTTAGLPADFQTVPILNFRNIASETEADQSLKLLSDIYGRAMSSGASFLSPEEVTKFKEFTATAINNNRAALTMNRTMMAPISN